MEKQHKKIRLAALLLSACMLLSLVFASAAADTEGTEETPAPLCTPTPSPTPGREEGPEKTTAAPDPEKTEPEVELPKTEMQNRNVERK